MRFHELTFFLGRPGASQNSLDCLLHPDHGVAAPVEQDVGRVGHQLLSRGLDNAGVTVKPGRVSIAYTTFCYLSETHLSK